MEFLALKIVALHIVFCGCLTIVSGGLFRFRFQHPYTENTCKLPSICTEVTKCSNLMASTQNQDYKQMRNNFCGIVNFLPKICCIIETSSVNARAEISEMMPTEELNDLQDHTNFKKLPFENCGFISDNLRITSGTFTSPEEFPWMVLIAYKTGGNDENFRCGGSIISEKYVLTAAHCVDESILGVRLGEYNISSTEDTLIQDVLINKIIVHPLYNSTTFFNDIALIKLATPANFNYENVKPICLPYGHLMNLNLTGRLLTVAGWGTTESGDRSTILRKVSIPIVEHDECQNRYKNVAQITRNQICAGGYEGKDSCAGDSGGPLKYVEIIKDSPRYFQYGIVSFGPKKCGIDKRPGIYTYVPKYMDWILDHIN